MIKKETIEILSRKLGEQLKAKKATFATAESCTGGNIAAAVTGIPGSSEYFKGGIVAYSNEVKMNLLHVKEFTLKKYGVVSEQTVREMVKGAMESLNTEYAIATSGIAGPDGGTPETPVGIVWIAAGSKKEIIALRQETDNGRIQNILRASENALLLLQELLQSE